MTIQIATINTRGIYHNTSKRDTICHIITQKKLDIVFLQETYITNINQTKHLSSLYNYKFYSSFGQTNSRGVSIMISNNLVQNVKKFDIDYEGRWIYIDIIINNNEFRLINIYCPNKSSHRKKFINNLEQIIPQNKYIILGGDFNFVENPNLDKNSENQISGLDGKKEINKIKEIYNLYDPFRNIYKEKREYTWNSGTQYRRLDRFYITNKLHGNINDVNTLYIPFTDHNMVILKLDENVKGNKIGNSFWKANVTIFDNKCFQNDLNIMIEDFKLIDKHDNNWWNSFKKTIKDLTIFHAKRISHEKHKQITKVKKELRELNENIRKEPLISQKIKDKENELNEMLLHKMKGAQIRTKSHEMSNNETASLYLFKKECKQQSSKIISKLKTESNQIIETNSELISYCRSYYSQLYTKSQTDESLIEYFTEKLPTLSEEQKNTCETPIKYSECLEAIHQMSDYKTPGLDGLPKEFYAKFFHLFGHDYVKMINQSLTKGYLPKDMNKGLITLICKDSKNSELLNNWRPISLLGTDYKIVSKVIANRIKKILENIISNSQNSSVPNRTIFDNCHLLRNIINYAEEKEIELIILNLDIEKAFDKISHTYLYKVLEKFGFGTHLISMIKTLYNNAESSVLVNGFISDKFKYERGVRQGCSLSPLLYIIAIEPMALKIKQDNSIKGITLPITGQEIKLTQYADDMSLFITYIPSIQKILILFDLFYYASGTKINKTKSKALPAGIWKRRPPNNIYNIHVVHQHKVLGCIIGNDEKNWEHIIQKIQTTFNLWKLQKLSFTEKAHIINFVIYSKLWYLGTFMDVPKDIISKIEKLTFNFIYNGKMETIKRETLKLEPKYGGIGLIDIQNKLKAIRLTHIKDIILGEHKNWKILSIYWIGYNLRQYENIFSSNTIPHSMFKPLFYKNTCNILKEFEKIQSQIEWGKTYSKYFYQCLQKESFILPRIVKSMPTINFIKAWKAINAKLTSRFEHDLNFKIGHNVVNTNQRLYKFDIHHNNKCYFCKDIETLEHLFYSCKIVIPGWLYIDKLICAMFDKHFKNDSKTVLYYNNDELGEKQIRKMYIIISSIYKYAIWVIRNEIKYNDTNFQKNDILNYFIHSLKARCRIDHERFNIDDFESLWCRKNLICSIVPFGFNLLNFY